MTEVNINAYCSICGAGYSVCNTCKEQKVFRAWRSVTDTIEHYKIYYALHGYTISKDREAAKNELKQCDLTGLEDFKPEIKAAIEEIMAEVPTEPQTENPIPVKRRENVKAGKAKLATDENIE